MTARTEFYNARPLNEEQLYKLVPSIFTTTAHPSRSHSFVPIPTIEAVRTLADANFLPFAATQSRYRDWHRGPYVKHMLKFRKIGSQSDPDLHVGDNILEVILTNGNDGSKAYHLDAGIFRIACLNGMVVKSRDYGSINIRHTGMDTLKRVLAGTEQIVDNANRVLDAPRHWSQLIVSEEVRNAFAKAAHKARFGDDGRITAAQLLIPRRPQDQGKDLWTMFNVVQENTVEGGLSAISPPYERSVHRRWTTRRVGAVDSNLRLNQKLWELAEQAAQTTLREAA